MSLQRDLFCRRRHQRRKIAISKLKTTLMMMQVTIGNKMRCAPVRYEYLLANARAISARNRSIE
jgi:hypothetical protein